MRRHIYGAFFCSFKFLLMLPLLLFETFFNLVENILMILEAQFELFLT